MSEESPKPAAARPPQQVPGGERPLSGPAARGEGGPGTSPLSGPAAPRPPPPRLARVPEGYRPPAVRPPSPAAQPQPGPGQGPGPSPSPSPSPGPAVPGARAQPPHVAPAGATYGLAEREVGADAAIAAGLAQQGRLGGDTTTFALFALAAGMQATGRLTLGAEPTTFALTFRRGTVEHAASGDPEDDLAAFLARRGSISAEALARAEKARAGLGGDLVSALIAERAVNPADIAALLQEHGAHIVQKALATESGSWSWNPQAPPPPGAFPLGPSFGMLCAGVRALDAAALARRLGEREHRAATRVGARIRVEDLRLTPQETRAAALFDGVRSPAELAAAQPADTLVILRLAVLLGDLQLLSFGTSRKGAPPRAPPPAAAAAASAPPAAPVPESPTVTAPPPGAPSAPRAPSRPTPAQARPQAAGQPAPTPAVPPAARTPAAARPAVTPVKPAAPPAGAKPAAAAPPAARPPAPGPPAPGALDPAVLRALAAKMKDQDHFAVLGVKQEAGAAQIKTAYFQLAKLYHPDAVPTDAPEELRKLAADVFAKVSEAWSVLGSDASRAEYLDRLRTGGTADVDVMSIFEAEKVFQDATLLVKARRYDEALRKFDEAIALNKDEAEFGMWKAWCEFILADDKKKKSVLASSAIEAELRRNPRCAQGYLFLGQMAKLVGDLAVAEKHLKRGLQVAPEHTDLQRELKYLRK